MTAASGTTLASRPAADSSRHEEPEPLEVRATTAPIAAATTIAWEGAPKIEAVVDPKNADAGKWSFKPRGRLQIDSGGVDAPSPHATGGAVDLTLRWRGGDALWMGSLFDDASPIAHLAHFETLQPQWSFSAEEARANRRLLYWLMVEAGFATNPNEWWHFSYGDQMWAQATGADAALYGGIEAAALDSVKA